MEAHYSFTEQNGKVLIRIVLMPLEPLCALCDRLDLYRQEDQK